ncbi:acyl carrier protein [bacterium BMS3Bbin14]|nr:acyl carrier protein [bacterium BMS3Abin13]GBE53695.1 acyl carrier protein [bacterium BMS3Bbin14]
MRHNFLAPTLYGPGAVAVPRGLNSINFDKVIGGNIQSMDALTEELKVKLIDILNLTGVNPADIDKNAQLVGGDLGIDSIDVLEMVVMVEKDYGVTINSQDVGEKVFSTLASLAEYIKENSSKPSP